MSDQAPGAHESWVARGRVLLAGSASGVCLVLDEPLSFWGGLDPQTGMIVDHRHPQAGASVAGRVLVMSTGRGSSSSSTVLAEALRAGTGPQAVLLLEADQIVLVGALVIELLDGHAMPVIQLKESDYTRLATGSYLTVEADGLIKNEATPPKRGRRTVPADPAT